MMLYRFVRYFAFLFLIVFTILYLLRNNIVLVPQLSSIFSEIDNTYNTTSQNAEDISIEAEGIQKFQQNADSLFQEQRILLTNFLQDISLNTALEAAINRNFNDLNYLIDTYLAYNISFKDVMIYRNNRLIYKYNNYYNPFAIILYNNVSVATSSLNIEFIFDESILQEQLDQIDELLFVKKDDKILYSSKYNNVDSDIVEMILDMPALFEGKEVLQRGRSLHGYMVTNDLKIPINTFILYQESFGWNSMIRGFLYLLFPLLWLLMIFLDRIFYRYLIKREQNMRQKSQFNNTKESDTEDSWDWVDRFIKIEDLTDKEMSYKEQEQKDMLEHQEPADIKNKDF